MRLKWAQNELITVLVHMFRLIKTGWFCEKILEMWKMKFFERNFFSSVKFCGFEFRFWILKLNFCGFYQSWIELFSLLLPIIRPANGLKMWFLIKIGGFYKKNCHKKDFGADNSPKSFKTFQISNFGHLEPLFLV